ncbi:MAG TPA: cadherin-like domain-containing protein, partial [Thermosynechococcaceae cyanobacterium]
MPDTIGNSFDSAQGTSLSPIFKTFTESIDPGDTDFYRFTLNRRSSFSLTLTNLSANLDVALFDGTGGAVVVDGVTQSSTNTGTLVESLNTILDPGTYYIQVFGGTPTATSAYNMNVLADDNVRSDVLWRNQAVGNGANVVWQLEGTQIANVLNPPPIPDVNWKAQASGDFNNDGLSDIVFRNTVSGDNVVWFLNETGSYIGEAALPQLTDINWDFVGAADFSGDGLADLALRNNVSGNNTVWLFSGTTFIGDSALPILPDTNFKLGGVGDFNGDGRPDLLWRNQVTGYNTIWALNGTDFVADAPIAAEPDLNLRFQGTGDFNRDGQTDILVRNFATGDNSIWAMSGTTRLQVIPFASLGDVNWVATAPFTRALPVVQKDLAGNQAAAFAIGALNGNGIYRDAVGGADPEDVYQFTVGSPTQLGLVLSGINGGALLGGVNVRLFNTSGTVGQNASPVGGVVNISRQIPAGTYFIQATGGSTTVGYELALAANNLPVLATNRLLVVSEGQAQTITPLLLRVTDENNTVEQITYSVATLPAQGSLLLDRSAITTGSLFSQADINNGRLQYSQNGSETLRDGFTFNVTDGVPGTVPINNASFSIQVVPVNDPPILLSNTALTLTEGSTVSLSSTVLFVTDTEQTDAQIRYTLSSLPTSGGLSLGGVPVTAGGTFTQADLAVPGRVIYRNNGSEASTDTFVFSASDGAGGIITPPTAAFSFNITNVNDIPVLVTNAGLTVTETGVRRIDNTLLRTTDSEQLTEALQDGIIYTVQTGPTQGTLTRNGTVTTTFTQADINNNRILYTETARGVNSDRFVFTVQDNVGEFTNPSPQTFNIAITGSNFVPVLTTNVGLSVTESLSAAITPTNLLVSDIDNAASELVYRVTKLPTNGFLKRFGTPLTALGETFTQADLNAPTSLISYQQNGSETTIDSFVFTVQDGNGNVAVPIDNTFSINVIAFNDAPQLLTNTRLTLSEGATANLTAGVLLQATDVDNLDSQITYNVTSGPLNGSLLRSGTTATSFTQADLTSAGLVRYQHNGSESTADSFLFEVVDLGGASAGTFTFNIAVTSVNDAPGLSLNTGLSLTEGASLNITDANLLLTDGDGPLPLIYTLTTAPTNGALRLAGSTVTTLGATNTFTQADITANRLTYIHNGSETTSDSFSFSASDSAPNGTAGLLPVTSFTIAVASVNDPPVLTVPGPLTVAEDNPLTLTGITRIQVSDPDTTPVTVTLSVGQGVINLPSGGAVVTGNDTNTVTVTGSTADLDIALNTLIYQPGANYNGPDTLSVSANDGNTTVDRTININVTPVNDAPTLSLSAASQTVDEDTPLALTIVTTDIDSGNTIIRSTLTAPNGRLTLATPGAVGFESGTTNGGSTLSLVGTISAIATALTNVSYQGARDFSGADTITVTVNDQGATGTGGALSVSRSLDVTVNPINDVPTFTLRTNSLTVNEDSG